MSCKRVVSGGSGLIFKGSGFISYYYKNKKNKSNSESNTDSKTVKEKKIKSKKEKKKKGIKKMIEGKKIFMDSGNLVVPDNPIIPFIEGDGIGADIWNASVRVFDSAVKSIWWERKINWTEILAGEKSYKKTGEWLPEETLNLINEHLIAIKGPLTTLLVGAFVH